MKKTYKIAAILTVAAMLMTSLAGCATFDAFRAEFFPGEQNAKETVKIGVFEPLSGEDKSGGELEKKGIELAHKLQPTCLGKDVELVYADNRSDLNAAAEAIRELIAKKPAVILGSYGSAYSLAAAEYIQKAKIPAISITNANPLVTKGNPYYFRVWFEDEYQGAVLGKYAAEVLGVTEAAVMRKQNDDAAIPVNQSFENKMIQLTGNANAVPYIIEYKDDFSDVRQKLEQLKKAGIKTIFLSAEQAGAVKILKTAEKMNAGFTFLGIDTWQTDSFPVEAGTAAEQAVVSTIYDSEAGVNKMSERFLKAYREEYGKDVVPEPAVALAFDAYMIAIDAMEQAGTSRNGEKIMQTLALTSKFAGASGNITFDANGDAMKTVIIKGVEDGAFVSVYTIEPNVV